MSQPPALVFLDFDGCARHGELAAAVRERLTLLARRTIATSDTGTVIIDSCMGRDVRKALDKKILDGQMSFRDAVELMWAAVTLSWEDAMALVADIPLDPKAMAAPADCAVVAAAFPALNITGDCCTNTRLACANGRLTQLNLGSLSLSRTLPSSLGQLTALQRFDVGINKFTGPIPDSLGSLTELTSLYLGLNLFTGPIPASLGKLTKLTFLNLGTNQFSGQIPDSLGGLASITQMYLDHNQFTGSIPDSLGKLTALTALSLNNNQLSGSIPSSLGNLAQLQSLGFGTNQLSGRIPSSLGNLVNLTRLFLDTNQFSGSVPSSFSKLTKLTNFNCAIPVGLFPTLDFGNNCCTSGYATCSNGVITGLTLSGANLTGSLSPLLSGLANVTSLDLSNNPQLSGPLPSGLSKVTSCNLSGTSLCSSGDAPAVCNAPSCPTTSSGLSGGAIGGIVAGVVVVIAAVAVFVWFRMRANCCSDSRVACLNDRVTSINFQSSQLSGPLPQALSQLTRRLIGQNNFALPVPESLGNLQDLTVLNVAASGYTGPVPEWFGNLKSLQTLFIFGNNLEGTIPASFSQIRNLTTFYINNNPKLTCELPATLYSQASCLASGTKLCSNNTKIQSLCKLSASSYGALGKRLCFL
nr:hypothetical protein HK105_007375 [Polyrhizophydium stewartii]